MESDYLSLKIIISLKRNDIPAEIMIFNEHDVWNQQMLPAKTIAQHIDTFQEAGVRVERATPDKKIKMEEFLVFLQIQNKMLQLQH